MKTLEAPRPISATARRHGSSRSLLTTRRRALLVESVRAAPFAAFARAVVVWEPSNTIADAALDDTVPCGTVAGPTRIGERLEVLLSPTPRHGRVRPPLTAKQDTKPQGDPVTCAKASSELFERTICPEGFTPAKTCR